MENNLLLIDIPCFRPQYKDELYSYDDEQGKKNLRKLLSETSKGHCMYCYTRIEVDGKNFGQLEHTIEKSNTDKLKNCIPNISIACPKCNLSFKRRGEKDRKLTAQEKKSFVYSKKCLKTKCKGRCIKYEKIIESYIGKTNGEIILQPFGVKNYYLQYDILDQKFIPKQDNTYKEKDIYFISRHINRFNLNDSEFRTREVKKFFEDLYRYDGNLPQVDRYNNYIITLIHEKLSKVDKETRIKICELVITQWAFKIKG